MRKINLFLVSCCSCWRNTTLRTMCHLPVDPHLVGSCLVSSAMAGFDKKSRCQPVHVSLLSCCLRLLSTVKEHMKRVHVSLHKPSCTFLVHSLLKTNTQIQFIQIQDAYECPDNLGLIHSNQSTDKYIERSGRSFNKLHQRNCYKSHWDKGWTPQHNRTEHQLQKCKLDKHIHVVMGLGG